MAVCSISRPLAGTSHSLMGSQMMESFLETMKAIMAPCWCLGVQASKAPSLGVHCFKPSTVAQGVEKMELPKWPLESLPLESSKSRWVCECSRLSGAALQLEASGQRALCVAYGRILRHRSAQLLPATLILQARQVRPRGSDWIYLKSNLSSGLLCKESACNAGDPGLIPGLRRFPWRRKWQPTPVFLPGKSHGWGAWWATVHGIAKVDMT